MILIAVCLRVSLFINSASIAHFVSIVIFLFILSFVSDLNLYFVITITASDVSVFVFNSKSNLLIFIFMSLAVLLVSTVSARLPHWPRSQELLQKVRTSEELVPIPIPILQTSAVRVSASTDVVVVPVCAVEERLEVARPHARQSGFGAAA